jgi:predicted nucleotidyltransferase
LSNQLFDFLTKPKPSQPSKPSKRSKPFYESYNFMEPNEITTEIENIVEQIIQKYDPLKIILFGSAGRGEYDKVNDLDFLIIKQDVPSYGLARMRELDELIDRNMAADMLVYRPDEFEERIKLGDPFIKAILKEGKVLYG